MRKITLFIHSTFNGVISGDPKKDEHDFNVWTTPESNEAGSKYLLEIMQSTDTVLLGRGTYELFNKLWPFIADWGQISDTTKDLGAAINNAHKVIVTGNRPLDELTWGEFAAPSQLSGADIEKQIKELKSGDGGDIIIFGSPVLVRALTDAALIDEYHFQVHPVVVNYGQHLFDTLQQRKDFELVGVKALGYGTIAVHYKPAGHNARIS